MIGSMKPESIVVGVSGLVFGLLVGWVIGTQQAPGPSAGLAAAPSAQAAPSGMPAARPALDEAQVTALKNIAAGDPANVQSRVQLGNLYFDAERYQDAIQWYDEALRLNPRDVDVSTDLAVCYYYTNQPDRAVSQLEASLRIDPKHTKTLLNLGIVRSFGQQDLAGAMAAWQQVTTIAPDSEEGKAAQRLLDNLKSAHPGGAMPPAGTPVAAETPKPAASGR